MTERATHQCCPNPECRNQNINTYVYQCDDGHLFCKECAKEEMGILLFNDCSVDSGSYIGWIEPRSAPYEDPKEYAAHQLYECCPRCKCNVSGIKVYECLNIEPHIFCQVCKKRNPLGEGFEECGEPGCSDIRIDQLSKNFGTIR